MQSAKRVTLVPPKEVQYGGSQNDMDGEMESITLPVPQQADKIKSKIYDKIHRFIKVILKLARTVGYDEDLKIKLKNGKYLEKSNIVDLLTHAMSVGKVLYGEDEFIQLLAESDVDPDLIINQNVKLKLIQYKNSNKKSSNMNDENEHIIVKETNQLEETPKRNLKVLKKGNKKFIIVNEDGATVEMNKKNSPRKPQEIIVNEDGATIEMESDENTIKKRKHEEVDSDSTIDDDLIDKDKWKIT